MDWILTEQSKCGTSPQLSKSSHEPINVQSSGKRTKIHSNGSDGRQYNALKVLLVNTIGLRLNDNGFCATHAFMNETFYINGFDISLIIIYRTTVA